MMFCIKNSCMKRYKLYLQCFVPAASHDTAVVGRFDPVDRFDWPIMLKCERKGTFELHLNITL